MYSLNTSTLHLTVHIRKKITKGSQKPQVHSTKKRKKRKEKDFSEAYYGLWSVKMHWECQPKQRCQVTYMVILFVYVHFLQQSQETHTTPLMDTDKDKV